MQPCKLNEDELQELLRLSGVYRREARKCMQAKSYLAGCIMIGAALETDIMAMCHCYVDEIPSKLISKKKGRAKPLLDWSLFQLITIARECEWIPSGLSLDDDWDSRKADVGDYSEVLRQIRNLVHPSCFVKDLPKSRMTKQRMQMCFDVLEAASSSFLDKIHTSLKAAVGKEQGDRTTAFRRRPKSRA